MPVIATGAKKGTAIHPIPNSAEVKNVRSIAASDNKVLEALDRSIFIHIKRQNKENPSDNWENFGGPILATKKRERTEVLSVVRTDRAVQSLCCKQQGQG